MKNSIVILTCASLLFLSCKKEVKNNEVKTDSITGEVDSTVVDMHNSQNALDWPGTYKGILPCADCKGIETALILNNDNTYSYKTKYLGKGEGKVFVQKGSFTWDETGGVISLSGMEGKPYLYKVGENTLTQLDIEGYAITGKLASMYILKK